MRHQINKYLSIDHPLIPAIKSCRFFITEDNVGLYYVNKQRIGTVASTTCCKTHGFVECPCCGCAAFDTDMLTWITKTFNLKYECLAPGVHEFNVLYNPPAFVFPEDRKDLKPKLVIKKSKVSMVYEFNHGEIIGYNMQYIMYCRYLMNQYENYDLLNDDDICAISIIAMKLKDENTLNHMKALAWKHRYGSVLMALKAFD